MSSPSFQAGAFVDRRPGIGGGSPPPYGGEPPPHGPVEVRVGGHKNLVRLSIVWCLLGVLLLQLVVAVAASGATRVVLCLGLPALAGVYLAVLAIVVVRTRKTLRIDPVGLACHDRRGTTVWSVPWSELSGVTVTTAYRISRGRRYYRMRMMLLPRRGAGTGAVTAAAAAGEGRYGAHTGDVGVPLARYGDLPRLDAALRAYAGPLYLGMVHEGMFMFESFD